MRVWFVYGLIYPEERRVVYVGITRYLSLRLRQHCTDPGSAMYEVSQELKKRGQKLDHCVFATFASEDAARFLEDALITRLPQIYNRTHYKQGYEFWSEVRETELLACAEYRKSLGLAENGYLRGDIVELPDARSFPHCQSDADDR